MILMYMVKFGEKNYDRDLNKIEIRLAANKVISTEPKQFFSLQKLKLSRENVENRN